MSGKSMPTMKPSIASVICLVTVLLTTTPVIAYATSTPKGIVTHPPYRVFLEAPVLLNSQLLPPGVMSNVSLRLLIYGHTDALNGTLIIQGNRNFTVPNAAPQIHPALNACTAVAKGSIEILNESAPNHEGSDIFVVVNATEPPDPCFAGLQGYNVVVQWQLLTGNVKLTAIPQTSSVTAAHPPLEWTGQSAAGSGITQLSVQSNQHE